jgi:hypothetical protein
VLSNPIADRGETKLIRAMAPIRTDAPNYGVRIAILLGAAFAIAPTSALAEVQVHGSSEAVTIQAHDISVEEVLAALSRTFDMDYQSAIDLDKRLYGTYVGPLSRVVTRILQGYNFVLKTDNGSIFVTVVGTPTSLAGNPALQGLPASSAPEAPAPQPRQSGVPAPVPRGFGFATTPAAGPASSAPMSAPFVGSKL